jgi:hypothetical protein
MRNLKRNKLCVETYLKKNVYGRVKSVTYQFNAHAVVLVDMDFTTTYEGAKERKVHL